MPNGHYVSDNELLKWQTGDMAYCLHVMHDDEPLSPLESETIVKLAFFGRNNYLGNEKMPITIEPTDYMVQLCRNHVKPVDAIAKIRQGLLKGIQADNEHDGLITLKDTSNNDVFEDVHAESVIDTLADNLTAVHCAILLEDVVYMTPIWAYEHSGITIKTGPRTYPYNDQWDSYYAGLGIMTKRDVITNFPGIDSENWKDKAEACVASVVETYDAYLTGDVWGYQLYELDMTEYTSKKHIEPNWNETESIWGFIGSDIIKSGMAESVGEGLPDALKADRVTYGTAEIEYARIVHLGEPKQ